MSADVLAPLAHFRSHPCYGAAAMRVLRTRRVEGASQALRIAEQIADNLRKESDNG